MRSDLTEVYLVLIIIITYAREENKSLLSEQIISQDHFIYK
jgi:hypothetical protein